LEALVSGTSVRNTAKLFMHGRSQAVRLPKEFRLPGTEVRVSRVGDAIVLEPIGRPDTAVDRAGFWASIDALIGDDFMASGREQPPMPEDRVLFDE
jgi:antitoxin VapB